MSANIKKDKLTLISLILMIFTSVFGFNNMPRSFFLMGYGAIPWYALSAITFFVPFAFMMAEFGAAFKNEKGGIYSWMKASVGPKFAFMGTFMWYASNIIWMVNVGSGIWVVFSNAIFGKDTTATWSLFGLSSTQTLGVLGVFWIVMVTFLSSKGLDKIKKVASVGGTAVALLNVFLIVGAFAVLIGNHGQLAQPINSLADFAVSPNPKYGSLIATFGFVVFAIFAYGGIEVSAGLVDQTENPEKTFPKGIAIAAGIIAVAYSCGIFLVGIFTNWKSVLAVKGVHMGNVSYVIMNNLGYQFGHTFGFSEAMSVQMGNMVARYVGISMLLALTGCFFTLSYAPLKQMIEGTPKALWPGKIGEVTDNMPKAAMWAQCVAVCAMIALVAFGGDAAAAFFAKLVLMTNVAMTIPYMFLSIAFIGFKRKQEIVKPFVVFKNYQFSVFMAVVVTFTVGFANFFTIIQPATEGDMSSTIWSIAGPVFFSIVALILYSRYEKGLASGKIKAETANENA